MVGGEILATLPGVARADVAQLAERVLGKDEVTGSIPVIGSSSSSNIESETPGEEKSDRTGG